MSSHYGLILVILTFASGIIWLIDAFTDGKKRKAALAKLYEQDPEPSEEAIEAVTKEPVHVDYSKSFFPILFVIVVLRSFLYEPFQIPSASMKPTLTEGDFILVNKFNYGLRLPVTSQKVIDINTPQRGEVAVFKAPHTGEDYIKRIVGLPGDTVEYTFDKELYVTPRCAFGTPPAECPKRMKITRVPHEERTYLDVAPNKKEEEGNLNYRYIENLDGVKHEILINPNVNERFRTRDVPRRVEVPQGHYFVMGDNRDNSLDSRYWGFVPEENLVGQAVAIWLHLDFGIETRFLTWIPTGIDLGRVGSIE